jgi:hypothetical protein
MSMTGAPIPECLPGDPGDNCQPIQFEILCDDNGPFLRRYQINCDTGLVLGFTDTLLDGTTAYAPVGTLTVCADSASTEVIVRQLCDLGSGGGVPGFQDTFLRVEVRNADGTLASSFDTEADGVTPYAPIGPVDFDCDCLECLPQSVSARREDFSGIFSWDLPANVVRFTVKVRALDAAGSVTATDNAAVVSVMFVGDEESWGNGSDTLATPFNVSGAGAGDFVTIFYEVIT